MELLNTARDSGPASRYSTFAMSASVPVSDASRIRASYFSSGVVCSESMISHNCCLRWSSRLRTRLRVYTPESKVLRREGMNVPPVGPSSWERSSSLPEASLTRK